MTIKKEIITNIFHYIMWFQILPSIIFLAAITLKVWQWNTLEKKTKLYRKLFIRNIYYKFVYF